MQRQAAPATGPAPRIDQGVRARPNKPCTVLAAVKDALTRAASGCFAILDRSCARCTRQIVVGTEKRLSVEQRNWPNSSKTLHSQPLTPTPSCEVKGTQGVMRRAPKWEQASRFYCGIANVLSPWVPLTSREREGAFTLAGDDNVWDCNECAETFHHARFFHTLEFVELCCKTRRSRSVATLNSACRTSCALSLG